MTKYETMLDYAKDLGCEVMELDLLAYDGRVSDNFIAIRSSIESQRQKADVLAEEIAHYKLTVGNILDQNDVNNQKQEHRARALAHDMRIGLDGVVKSYKEGCRSIYEMSEYLDVSEDFLRETLEDYRRKYGEYVEFEGYLICFEPSISVIEVK